MGTGFPQKMGEEPERASDSTQPERSRLVHRQQIGGPSGCARTLQALGNLPLVFSQSSVMLSHAAILRLQSVLDGDFGEPPTLFCVLQAPRGPGQWIGHGTHQSITRDQNVTKT